MPTHQPPQVAFGHVGMITPDLDRARRFYEDIIGLRTVIIEHPQGAAFRRMAALADSAGTSVILLLFEIPGYDSGLPDDVIGRRGRLDHLSFRTGPEEFERVVDRLVTFGVSNGRVDALGPRRSVLFVDPDGGHHSLQTANPDWVPSPSSDVLDREVLDHLLAKPRT